MIEEEFLTWIASLHKKKKFSVETHRTAGEGRGPSFIPLYTSTRSRTFRHLFATLHVWWLSHVFNRTACIYKTASRWDLPPYRITIWLIDDVTLGFCLFTWWFDSSFFVTAIWDRKPVDSNSHLLSPLYYKRTNYQVCFQCLLISIADWYL